jgi:hypothetical protein
MLKIIGQSPVLLKTVGEMRSLRKDILDRLVSILEDEGESTLFVKWSENNFVDESVKFLLTVMQEKRRMIAEAWYGEGDSLLIISVPFMTAFVQKTHLCL